MTEKCSVLIVNQAVDAVGIIANAAFVLGLSAGRGLPDDSFGPAVTDGDGSPHASLTMLGHFVRKASATKVRTLRDTFAVMPDVMVTDYTEAAAPSDYYAYAAALAAQQGEAITYRAIHVYGPAELIVPLTKNLSKL